MSMANTKAVATVAIIAVILVLAGTYLATNDNDKDSITGTYTLYDGQQAYMDANGGIEYVDLLFKEVTVDSCDGNIAKVTLGGVQYTGSYSDGKIMISDVFTDDWGTFVDNSHITVTNGILYYCSVAGTTDGSYSYAYSAVFVKSGKDISKVSVSEQSLMDVGDVYSMAYGTISVDGKCSDLPESVATITLKSIIKGIYVLECKGTDSEPLLRFAVRIGEDSLLSGYDPTMQFVNMYVKDDLLLTTAGIDANGSHIAIKNVFAKGENLPDPPKNDLSGLVYNGIRYYSDNQGKVSTANVSIAFGETDGLFTYAVFNVNGCAYMKTVNIITGPEYRIQYTSAFTKDGIESTGYAEGFLSKDLKTLTLLGNIYHSNGTTGVSKCIFTLSDDSDFVGCYKIDEYSVMKGLEYSTGKSDDNGYGEYFTVSSVKNDIATGTYFSRQYVGEVNGNMISFKYYTSENGGYDKIADATFVNGGCYIRYIGADIDDETPIASVTTYTLVGKDTGPEMPIHENKIKVGDSVTTFGAVKRVNNVDVPVTELGQTLTCLKAENGLYAFLLTDNGKESILNGRWSASENVFRLAGYNSNDELITYNLNIHNDFICLDREYTEDGKNCIITYRMSSDGSEKALMDIVSLNGKTYKGTSYGGRLVDGKLTYVIVDVSVSFSNQNMAIVSMSQPGVQKILDAHILLTDNDNLKLNYFFTVTDGGMNFNFETYGWFSSDLKTLTLEGLACKEDCKAYSFKMDLALAE